MWEIVVESVVPAIILGIFATVISVILNEKFTSHKEKKDKQYILLKDIYGLLFDEYKNIENTKDVEEDKDSSDAVELYFNARIHSYNFATSKFETLQKSLKKVRFVFTENELKDLDERIKETNIINNRIMISRLYYTLQNKENAGDIKLNYNLDDIYPIEKIDNTMADFVTNVNALFEDYTVFIEKKLRNLIH